MPFSASLTPKNTLASSAAIGLVAAAVLAPAPASASASRPRVQSVDAAILVAGGLPPNPYVTVKTPAGSTSSVAVFWMGKRTDLGSSPSESTGRSTAWTASLPGVRKNQRVRLQITASGPGGTATTTRTVRFAWRSVWR
jgi:hypothetical protein